MKADAATKKAREQAYKYADKQLRQRAYTIAITENAAAYCAGYREGAAQAQAQGYLGKGVYVFATADDEASAPVCSALNGTETDAEGSYHIGTTKMAFQDGPTPAGASALPVRRILRGEGTARLSAPAACTGRYPAMAG